MSQTMGRLRGVALVVAFGVVGLLWLSSCGGSGVSLPPPDEDLNVKTPDGKYDASAIATVLDFEFDGEVVGDSWKSNHKVIEAQLLYTVGQLNGENSVGRLDHVDLSDITTEADGNLKRIRYHARLPVAWGSKTDLPTSYTFIMPRDASYNGTEEFTSKYMESCVDPHAHDVDSGIMWYYYRPHVTRCSLDDADVLRFDVKVTVSTRNTTGKYPEYHKVWEDGFLRVVAVFGKYEDGATEYDAGISAYNSFVSSVESALESYDLVTVPEEVPFYPGVEVPEVSFTARLDETHTVEVVVFLVDSITNPGPGFDERYEQLSERADFIAYNGHSGLGQNIRALTQMGSWVTGQYVILFLNGCDTFAYIDSALADAHMAVNPDDPEGIKYLDTVVNGMPEYFSSESRSTMALLKGLMAFAEPVTFEHMFESIDSHQVVLVTGEQDNVYFPGYQGGEIPQPWGGIDQEGSVGQAEEQRFETPHLSPGTYRFEMTGSGGDADLYVRLGEPPTLSTYDCRPYRWGSNETCVVELNTATPVHVMVRGFSGTPSYRLVGSVE